MTGPQRNTWHVEISTRGANRNKSHRRTVRLEDRERTQVEAETAARRTYPGCRPAVIIAVSQRCVAEARHGRRCGRYTRRADGLCKNHATGTSQTLKPGGGS